MKKSIFPSGLKRGLQRHQELVVFVRRSDRNPQAASQQWVRAIQILDQYPVFFQFLKHLPGAIFLPSRVIRNKIKFASDRKNLDSIQSCQAFAHHLAFKFDRCSLLQQNIVML